MNTSTTQITARNGARPSVIQTGAAAMLLGAALLASSGVRAASPSPAAPPAPPAPAAPAAAPAQPGEEARADRDAARAEREAARAAARAEQEAARAEARADQDSARAEQDAARHEASRQQRDKRLRDAQERLNKATAELAELAADSANDALDGFRAWGGGSRRSVIGVQLSSEYKGEGAQVEDVSPGGPAENAGVKAGDVIVRVNGQEIKDAGSRQVVRLLRDVKPDSKVRLRVRRNDGERDIDVVARAVSPETFVFRYEPPPGFNPGVGTNFNPFGFGPRSELVGLEVTTLTPQLGRYFGTNKGVLVVRAPSQDNALKLQDGDVILTIDGREPTSSSHIARILSSYQPGEKLTLRVMRDQKVQDIVVTLAERAPTRGRTRTSWVDPAQSWFDTTQM